MTSRKRPSDTAIVVVGAAHDPSSLSNDTTTNMTSLPLFTPITSSITTCSTTKSRLRVRMKRFHGVAKWTWNAGSDDEVCGICQSAFEGVAPGVKYPGDECPVVFGKCGHAFHLQCVSTWLNSSRNTCPICRREWEFGQSTDQRRNDNN